jgi:hypothetical protein
MYNPSHSGPKKSGDKGPGATPDNKINESQNQ